MTNDDYVRLRKKVKQSLDYFIRERNTSVVAEGIVGEKITMAGYVNELIMSDLIKRGHYPPRVK